MDGPEKVQAIRHFSGYLVVGQEIDIALVPQTSGLVGVAVHAHPALTGYDRTCRLGQEGAQHEFGLGGIKIDGGRLECLHGEPPTQIYREGFSVVLEVGMAKPIQQCLPKLARIATLAKAIERRIEALLGDKPWAYRHAGDFILNVLAAAGLDGLSAAEATAQEASSHFIGKDEAYMALFKDEQIQALLDSVCLMPDLRAT